MLIGITATIPVEIVFAAGYRPVDLNNLFITADQPDQYVARAEDAGFSHTICAWIKGIYTAVIHNHIKKVIAVTGGDCSYTIALGELLARRGIEVIAFEYPQDRNRDALKEQMDKLRKRLCTTWAEIDTAKSRLDRIRAKLKKLDQLTYQDNRVTGFENHQFLVSSSDFNGNPDRFEEDLDRFMHNAQRRRPVNGKIRLGYLGVPPVFNQFYEKIESLGARVVFNEVQRQFSMPFEHQDLVDQYLEYTYPYGVGGRIRDIEQAVEKRCLHGLIHYAQTFCYRQIYDIMLRESLPLPMLTLEGDRPGRIDGRTTLRIETFVEMLAERLNPSSH